jgi:hypothetical protein
MSKARKTIHQPHDKGFRALLQSRKAFMQLLRYFVGADWVSLIDEQALIRVDKSFILQDFAGKEADIVYRCRLGGQDVFFYVLLELQSSVDQQMPWRLLQYMLEIWRNWMNDTEAGIKKRIGFRLPPIVPVVLYNGKHRWTAQRSFKDYQAESLVFGDCLVDFKYHLVDIKRWDPASLLKMEGILPLAIGFDGTNGLQELLLRLQNSLETINQLEPEEMGLLAIYLKRVFALFLEKSNHAGIQELPIKAGEGSNMFSNVERAIKKEIAAMKKEERREGKLEGKQEGKLESVRTIAARLIQKGMSSKEVSELTDMPLKDVMELMPRQN